MKKRYLLLAVFVIILIVIVAWVLISRRTQQASPLSAANNTPTSQLEKSNPDFSAGMVDFWNGDNAGAILLFKKALANEKDPALAAQVEYNLASAYESNANYSQAIQIFQDLAAKNQQVWPIMAAYAVQSLGSIHYDALGNTQVTHQIFSTAPYSSFGPSATTSEDVAYRNLYEYAISIYPLGIADTRDAIWYAEDLYYNLNGATTTAAGMKDLSIISVDMSKADADVQRVKGDPIGGSDIPEIRARQSIIAGYLTAMGAGSSQVGDNYIADAINYSAAANQTPAFVKFYDAVFLLIAYGPSRSTDISTVLSVFSAQNSANIGPVLPIEFADGRTDPGQQILHKWLVALGNIDSSFKSYLLTIGWQNSDF